MSDIGVVVTASQLDTSGSDGVSVLAGPDFAGSNALSVSDSATSGSFTGSAAFSNTLAWACPAAIELAGGGTVTFRQWKAMDGGVQQYAGTMRLESSYLHGTTPQVYLGPAIVDAAVIGNVGNTAGFVVDNAKGDPDVALNVRK